MLIPLTVPETRRLLDVRGDTPTQQRHRLRWSHWRRRHQATAKRGHMARRARDTPPTLCVLMAIAVPGTPALTEGRWKYLAPLLPPRHGTRGRLPGDGRPILAGLLWMMHTGVGWRAIPARFGSWHTLYSRYQQWCHDGTWERVIAALSGPDHEDQLSL